MNPSSIQTTTVGSYPVPDWLVALPASRRSSTRRASCFKTQEMAGIDVVCDGELYRFDVNHPETNGMIEYFIRPMAGIRSRDRPRRMASRSSERRAWASAPSRPAWSKAPIGEGTLNLPRRLRAREALTIQAAEVHAHRPAHAGQDAARHALQATASSRWRSPTCSPSR